MTRPFFSRERISDFETFGRHADEAISKLKARFNEPGYPAADFQDVVSRFTLDSATEFVSNSPPLINTIPILFVLALWLLCPFSERGTPLSSREERIAQ